jgi:hypothetical protein
MCVVWSALRAQAAHCAELDVRANPQKQPVEHVNLHDAQRRALAGVEVVHHLGNENAQGCAHIFCRFFHFCFVLGLLAPRTLLRSRILHSALIGLFSLGPPIVLYVVLNL